MSQSFWKPISVALFGLSIILGAMSLYPALAVSGLFFAFGGFKDIPYVVSNFLPKILLVLFVLLTSFCGLIAAVNIRKGKHWAELLGLVCLLIELVLIARILTGKFL